MGTSRDLPCNCDADDGTNRVTTLFLSMTNHLLLLWKEPQGRLVLRSMKATLPVKSLWASPIWHSSIALSGERVRCR